jgi:hypothetical protein
MPLKIVFAKRHSKSRLIYCRTLNSSFNLYCIKEPLSTVMCRPTALLATQLSTPSPTMIGSVWSVTTARTLPVKQPVREMDLSLFESSLYPWTQVWMSPRGEVNRWIRIITKYVELLTLLEEVYVMKWSSRVHCSGVLESVSKVLALHKQLIPKISTEAQQRNQTW